MPITVEMFDFPLPKKWNINFNMETVKIRNLSI